MPNLAVFIGSLCTFLIHVNVHNIIPNLNILQLPQWSASKTPNRFTFLNKSSFSSNLGTYIIGVIGLTVVCSHNLNCLLCKNDIFYFICNGSRWMCHYSPALGNSNLTPGLAHFLHPHSYHQLEVQSIALTNCDIIQGHP